MQVMMYTKTLYDEQAYYQLYRDKIFSLFSDTVLTVNHRAHTVTHSDIEKTTQQYACPDN